MSPSAGPLPCAWLSALLLAAAAGSSSPQVQAADRRHTGPADGGRADGAALYARYCALCHGVDREGYAADHAPSLRAPELWESASPAWLWYAVAYGRPGTAMAAFAADQGGPLSHDDQHLSLTLF